jgi:hypothetical protein
MAAILSDPPVSAALPRRRFTADEYARLTSLGLFDGERLELLFGEIIESEALRTLFGAGFRIRVQLPLVLTGSQSIPEPDVAVVLGGPRDFSSDHPTGAALVVEVSDTTLEADQTTKALAFARGGIEEYWLVNINERTLEVRRQPSPTGYRSLQTFLETDRIAPLVAPEKRVLVADILP